MSAKKYTDLVLQRYHYWREADGDAASFCRMKGLNRDKLSKHYCIWKRKMGIS